MIIIIIIIHIIMLLPIAYPLKGSTDALPHNSDKTIALPTTYIGPITITTIYRYCGDQSLSLHVLSQQNFFNDINGT